MIHDPSRQIRRHIARNMCESLAILYSIGDIKSVAKEESVLIEEDGSTPEKNREPRKTDPELMYKSLRRDKDIGKNEVLRESIMPILL